MEHYPSNVHMAYGWKSYGGCGSAGPVVGTVNVIQGVAKFYIQQSSNATGWQNPKSVAVNQYGDVFVLDSGLNNVFKISNYGNANTFPCEIK